MIGLGGRNTLGDSFQSNRLRKRTGNLIWNLQSIICPGVSIAAHPWRSIWLVSSTESAWLLHFNELQCKWKGSLDHQMQFNITTMRQFLLDSHRSYWLHLLCLLLTMILVVVLMKIFISPIVQLEPSAFPILESVHLFNVKTSFPVPIRFSVGSIIESWN